VSRILVFNVPAHGHVNPTLPVVRELVSRGEQVAYYLTDEFEPQIRHTGAEFRRIEDMRPGSGLPSGVTAMGQTDPARVRQMMAAFFPRMMAGGLRLVPRLVDRVRAESADYVVYDPFCPWGRALVRILELPAVAFVPSYAMTENFPLMHRLSSIFEEQTLPEAEEAISDFRDVSRELHDRYGLAPLRLTDMFAPAEALNIITMPRPFQPDADALDERYVFVGPSISPRSEASGFPLDLLAGNPTLYISLGTVFNANPEFFTTCFEALADSAWQVVLSMGTRTDPSTFVRIPDNFLVRPHVPQLEVLEHTDVFITHGGMNSVMEAIYYGVPMVVVPQQPEQAMTAARVAELGLGVALETGQVTAGALRDAVTTVSDAAGYRTRIAHMQQAAHEAGGYLRAADAIQQFGRTRSASGSGPVNRPALLRGWEVVLRPLRADDVERVAEIQAEPGVAHWWGLPNEAELRRQADGSGDEKALAIERERELVGLIQYHEENEPDFRHAGIDVFLTGRAQGRGLGTDAVRTLARYLIYERGHHRLTIDPATDNAAAIRAYEKVGFRAVGIMREYWRSPDGTWRDGLLMDLLAREFDRA
jgi:MGT family glycosyltransferase